MLKNIYKKKLWLEIDDEKNTIKIYYKFDDYGGLGGYSDIGEIEYTEGAVDFIQNNINLFIKSYEFGEYSGYRRGRNEAHANIKTKIRNFLGV